MDITSIHTMEALMCISNHCPEALSTYVQCMTRADKDGIVAFTKEQVDVDLSEEYEVFRSRIKSLAREHLLEWHPIKSKSGETGISITLVNLDMDIDYDE